jgi:hypothetical protein
MRCLEIGLQHIGAVDIPSADPEGDRWPQRKGSAALRIKHRGEAGGRVKFGKAHPVDAAVGSHEREGPAIPDGRVVVDRQIAVFACDLTRLDGGSPGP